MLPFVRLYCFVRLASALAIPAVFRRVWHVQVRFDLLPVIKGTARSQGALGTKESASAPTQTGDEQAHESEDENTPMPHPAGSHLHNPVSSLPPPPLESAHLRFADAAASPDSAEALASKAPPARDDNRLHTIGEARSEGSELVEQPPVLSSLSLLQLVQRRPLPGMRMAAAAHIQFELLLSTTKYVIPLATLVVSGQAFNGLFSSMITAQVTRLSQPDGRGGLGGG